MDPILTFLGASGEVFNYAKQYSSLIVYGIPFQFVAFSLNGIIRAEGNPKTALSTLLISGILNIILNPIFIFVMHLGIRGSALATIFAQLIGAIWVISYFSGKRSILKLRLSKLSLDLKIVMNIFSIGISPFLMQITGSFITFLFNKTLLTYGGDLAVAAMGIGNSIIMLIMMPIYGLNQGIQPIIGFNYGAKQFGRVRETLKKGMLIATAICLVGFLIIMIFATNIVGVFNSDDAKLISLGSHSLRIFLLMLPLAGFQIVSWAYFQAVGKPRQSLILTTTKQVLLFIPLIYILPHYFKLDGVWMTGPVSDLISACIAAVLLLFERKRLKKMELSYLNN
jgi:putative MATE family efflux protein